MSRRIIVMLTISAWTGLAAAQSGVDPSEAPLWQTAVASRGLPALHDDTVFVLSADHEVVALARDDGRILWRRSTGERGWTTEGSRVVVAGDTVIAGDWDLFAYDVRTGVPRWTFRPVTGYAPGYFLGVASGSRVFTGSPSGRLYAVESTTGRQLWQTPVAPVTDGGPLASVYAPVSNGRLVVAGYTIYSAQASGGVVAVDAASGRELWRFPFPVPTDSLRSIYYAGGPVLTDDLAIAAGGDGQVWGLDLASGRVRWSIPPLSGPIDGIITVTDQEQRALAVVGTQLLVGSLTGYLTAYDLATQREVWQLRQGSLGSLSWHDLTHADGVVYVPFVSGFLHAVDAGTGAVLWQTRDFRRGLSWPVLVSGDRLFAASASGVWALPAARPQAPREPAR